MQRQPHCSGHRHSPTGVGDEAWAVLANVNVRETYGYLKQSNILFSTLQSASTGSG